MKDTLTAFKDSIVKENPVQAFTDNKGIRKNKLKSRLGQMKQMGLKAYKIKDWDTISDEDFKFIVDAHKAALKNKKAIKKLMKDPAYAESIKQKEFLNKRGSLIKTVAKRWKERDPIYVTCKEEQAEAVIVTYAKNGKGERVTLHDPVKKVYPFVSNKEKEQVREFFGDDKMYT